MEGEITPAIGPAHICSWQGENSILPDWSIFSASSPFLALPSKISAPIMAPRIGPAMRSQVTGGPACKSMFSCRPGTTSIALAIVVAIGRASIMRWVTSVFALSISMGTSRSSAGDFTPILYTDSKEDRPSAGTEPGRQCRKSVPGRSGTRVDRAKREPRTGEKTSTP